jgi:DNA-binding HxlR family transcriptional regulator
MAKTKHYQHFCPVARSLEVIGEKWSLLVVRDLLRGTQRFSDLQRYLGGITPKWLSQRLRDLEEAGIVERLAEPGRREVWYRLTPKGRDLEPVIRSLVVWGIDHAMRPPLPGEPVYPEQTLQALTAYLSASGVRLPRPVTWLFIYPERMVTVRFHGDRWSVEHGGDHGDVIVTATAHEWIDVIMSEPRSRAPRLRALKLQGEPDRVEEFVTVLSGRTRAPSA